MYIVYHLCTAVCSVSLSLSAKLALLVFDIVSIIVLR